MLKQSPAKIGFLIEKKLVSISIDSIQENPPTNLLALIKTEPKWINAMDSYSRTLVFYAVSFGNVKLLEELATLKFDLAKKDMYGASALMWEIIAEQPNKAICEFLIHHDNKFTDIELINFKHSILNFKHSNYLEVYRQLKVYYHKMQKNVNTMVSNYKERFFERFPQERPANQSPLPQFRPYQYKS